MADERFGASFTIDISQLQAGLKTANKLIKENESEFKKAAAGLDKYSDAQKLAEAKISSLSSITEIQRKKVDALKANYKKLVDEGLVPTSDRAIALRTQINKEEAALAANEKELKDQREALENLGKVSDEAGDEIEDTGKKAEQSSKGFTVMRGALANLVSSGINAAIKGAKSLAKELVNVGQKADELNTLSLQSGFAVEELQKFEYASELIDVSVEDIISSAKKLKKNMVSNSKDTVAAFEKLGVAVRDDMTGELRDSTDVFYDVVAALKNVENETERDTLAMQLFGKNADSLAGIIDDGGEALKEYGKEAEDLGIILSSDAVNAANEFNDSIDKIKSSSKGIFYTIGAEIAKELSPEVTKIQKKVQKIIKSDAVRKFAKNVVKAIRNVIGVMKEIGKVVIPIVSSALEFLTKNFKAISAGVLAAAAAFAAFKTAMAIKNAILALSNPITAVTAAIGLLAAGLAVAATNTGKLSEEQEKQKKQLGELSDSVDDYASSWSDVKTAQSDAYNLGMSELSYYENLWKELQKIVDENGKVKKGYEERAAFIVSELNKSSLNTEIEFVDGQIQKYGELKSAIEDAFSQKRAQILLDAQQPAYQEAQTNLDAATRTLRELEAVRDNINATYEKRNADVERYNKLYLEAYNNYNEAKKRGDDKAADAEWRIMDIMLARKNKAQELADAEKELLDEAQKKYDEQQKIVQGYLFDISQYEDNLAKAHAGRYDEMTNDTWEYVSQFQDAADREKQLTQDKIANEREMIRQLKSIRTEDNKDQIDAQIAQHRETIRELRDHLKACTETTEKYTSLLSGIWSDSLDDQLSEITGREIKFKEDAEGLVTMYVDGVKQGEPMAKEEMAKLVSDSAQVIIDNRYKVEEAGKNVVEGFGEGINNKDAQNGVFGAVSRFGEKLLGKLMNSLQEKSPSKATEQMGEYLLAGLDLGVEKGAKASIKNVAAAGKKVLAAIRGSLGELSGAYDIGGLSGITLPGGSNVNNSRTVTVTQYNTFSRAHSQYELYKTRKQTAAAVRLALSEV